MAVKTKKKTGKKIYTCKTCGKIATAKGHLCAPVPQEKTVVCEYCGIVETDTRHVCVPKVLKFKYACGNCGRVAVSKSLLCVPRVISQVKAKTAGKKTTSKKKKKQQHLNRVGFHNYMFSMSPCLKREKKKEGDIVL